MILFLIFMIIFVIALSYQYIPQVYLQTLWSHVKVPLEYAFIGTLIFIFVVGFAGVVDFIYSHITVVRS